MADEPDPTQTTEESPRQDLPRTYEQMANRHLRRAMKSLNLKERTGDEQASFHMAAAQTYAIIEVASAIRDSSRV